MSEQKSLSSAKSRRMYRLIQSPQLRPLARHLAKTVREMQVDCLLKPQEILVPNRDTARWLTLVLADINGISANLKFLLPAEWVWRMIRKLQPELPDMLPSDPGPMAWTLFRQLSDPSVVARFKPLKEWIDQQGEEYEVGLFGIARSIASVFDQYQVYRPQMLSSWDNGESLPLGDDWQADLWIFLNEQWAHLDDDSLRAHRGILYQNLVQKIKSGEVEIPDSVLLFNPGLLPPPVSRAVEAVSIHSDLYHYQICSTPGWTLSNHQDPFSHAVYECDDISPVEPNIVTVKTGTDNPILKSLAGEQLEQLTGVRALAVSDHDNITEEWLPPDSPGSHLLGVLQRSILEDRPLTDLSADVDDSVVVRSAHSALREVESLHQFLLSVFSNDPSLAPDQVAVVTPDLSRYRTYLESIFGTEESGLPSIPLHIPGNRDLVKNRIYVAFRHLLQLPETRLRMDEVMEFAGHEAIAARYGFDRHDLSLLDTWFRENTVTWGLDDSHRSRFEQPSGSIRTWVQAMDRGWLGQMVSSRPGELWGDQLLFAGVGSSEEKELWAKFQRLLRSVRWFVEQVDSVRSVTEWDGFLSECIDLFLPREALYEQEVARLKATIRNVIREIACGELKNHSAWSFSLIADRLLTELEEDVSGTALFTGGVVVHTMVPLRSLPFKVVALLGLNEEHFPRKPDRISFDLMAKNRYPGERDHRREDRNLFLESMMAASDYFYASYIGRSQKDDEELPPSVILQEWLDAIGIVAGREPDEIVDQQPLNGFSSAAYRKDHLCSYSGVYLDVLRNLNREAVKGIGDGEPLPPPEPSVREVTDLAEIESFFRNPPAVLLRNRLDLKLSDYRKDQTEEFTFDGLDRYLIFRQIFEWTLEGWSEEKMAQLLLASARMPEGWSGEREVYDMIEQATIAIEGISSVSYTTSPVRHDIDIILRGNRIEGSVYSYSTDLFLDLHPSRLSGRRYLASWIRHLTLSVAGHIEPGQKSMIYSGFQNSDNRYRKWTELPSVADPSGYLGDLFELYDEGLRKPLKLYIDSAFSYAEERYKKGTDSERALEHARVTWEGGFKRRAERDDPFIRLLWGEGADLDPDELMAWAETLYARSLKPREKQNE